MTRKNQRSIAVASASRRAGCRARRAPRARSDYPNQINNVLAFPGVFRGLLDSRARAIDDRLKLAAAEALAGLVGEAERSAEYIIPSVFDQRVVPAVAAAVEQAAGGAGLARQ
jgi:malate dehydrogenase (oxaloacetate-decarboxylating)